MLASTSCLLCLALLTLGQGNDQPTYTIHTRSFKMPVSIEAGARDNIQAVRLLVSEDYGKTWKMSAQISPDTAWFTFTAAQDGTYWFMVQTETKDGKCFPPDPTTEAPNIKVRVDTQPR